MKNNCIKFALVFFLLLIGINFANAGYPADHSDSFLRYETERTKESNFLSLDDCFSTGKVVYAWEFSEFNNTFMPSYIGSEEPLPFSDGSTIAGLSAGYWATVTAIATAMIAAANPISALICGITLAVVLGTNLGMMSDACTNIYNVMAHEWINREAGHGCSVISPAGSTLIFSGRPKLGDGDQVVFNNTGYLLTATDVPYFFHCTPDFDPVANNWAGRTLDITNPKDAGMIGRTYGYGGTLLCGIQMRTSSGDAFAYDGRDKAGRIYVERIKSSIAIGSVDLCDKSKRDAIWVRPSIDNSEQYLYPVFLWGHYKVFERENKVKLCASSLRTMFAFRAACGYIAPPADANTVPPELINYVSGSRCYYLVYKRSDLQSLGAAISEYDSKSPLSKQSVKNFLMSDLHVTSTIVGCIKDLLFKVFLIPSPNGTQKSFFQIVQERLKQIILSVFVLYVSLMGIKIITSPEPPKRNEAIMMVVKLALVFYFTLGDVMYNSGTPGKPGGLFPQLLQVTDEISSFFLQAQNAGDPLQLCAYDYRGQNLLGEVEYPAGGSIVATEGQNNIVKLTVWDLIDCKLISYLNFGTCDYTPKGMVAAWLAGTLFPIAGAGLVLAIVCFVYCFMLLLVIFKYTHICILAFLVVTILIFLSPIFILFALFGPTKRIFDKWFQLVFGYLIYPALLFAFMSIMLATFDSIYYGIKVPAGQSTANIKDLCQDVESIYCAIMPDIATDINDPCKMSPGYFANKNITVMGSVISQAASIGVESATQMKDTGRSIVIDDKSLFNTYSVYSDSGWQRIWKPLLKLLLFAFLFYLFMGSVSEFMSALLQIQDLGKMAMGSVNAAGVLGGIGSLLGGSKKNK
jgi:type IV secretion system protein VirB6